VETIRQIFAYQPKSAGEQFAKDIYMLSFCLCGMNAADLYTCSVVKNDVGEIRLVYNRAKTKSHRADRAEMQIGIQPEIMHLLEKYRNVGEGNRIFEFADRFVNVDGFNAAVNSPRRGLRKIGKSDEVNVDRLTLYTARHSWATIAVNNCGIPEELVDDCLAHAPKRKMLHLYVKKDWSRIDKANRQVLNYVFGLSGSGCRQL